MQDQAAFVGMLRDFFSKTLFPGGSGDVRKPGRNFRDRLEEKHFRRVEKFVGDSGKFRGWLFDVLVGVGMVNRDLQEMVKRFMARRKGNDPMEWQVNDECE